jgi:hypothetical protein
MSRPLVALLALAALSLLALPAAAQSATGSLTISGLASDVTSNQTQAVVPFTVQVNLGQTTCVGGTGQFKVDLTATRGAGNASVEVQPASLTFQVPQGQVFTGAYSSSGGAVLVVKPGLVRQNTTIPVTVKAATTVTCSVPAAGMAPGALSAEGKTTLRFTPVSEEVANGPSEALPGLELPALVAAVGLAAVFAARRKA